MEKLIEILNLKKHFTLGRGQVLKAVDGVSVNVSPGETLGLVGESGCGKTTLGRTLVRLYQPTEGQVLFEGIDVHHGSSRYNKNLCRRMQMLFQDPRSSLNPRMTAGEIIGEAMDIHNLASGQQRSVRISELMSMVGLSPGHTGRYPHEFSGGQQQRIALARTLAVQPDFIVCDEPVSALDVSIQSQILNLLMELQESLRMSYLFISHDLTLVRHVSHRVAVMYMGRVVEVASGDELYIRPAHPYARALISAIPSHRPGLPGVKPKAILWGEPPSPINPTPGCAFRTRCPQAAGPCRLSAPPLRDIGGGHLAACHLI